MEKVFVLVQTRNYPDYVLDCIKQIRCFNNNPIFLLSDNEYYKNRVKNITNIEVINTNEIKKTEKHIFFIKNQTFDNDFRNGFWASAVERFFFIEDFLNITNIQDSIQIETDNLIYNDFSRIFDIMHQTSDFSLVLDHKSRCIPSIIYIKNKLVLEGFNSFYIENCLTNSLNDMQALALFFKRFKKRFLIKNLPITIPEIKFDFLKIIHNITYYENFNLFNGIFDAAAFGQYLGGIDPRNVSGNTVGFINETSVVKPNKYKILWENDCFGRKKPFIKQKNKIYPIYNLHIHSKNLKDFISENY